MDADLAEGVLFYEGSMADGVQAGDYVKEITTREQLQAFINSGDDHVLKVGLQALQQVIMACTDAVACSC